MNLVLTVFYDSEDTFRQLRDGEKQRGVHDELLKKGFSVKKMITAGGRVVGLSKRTMMVRGMLIKLNGVSKKIERVFMKILEGNP